MNNETWQEGIEYELNWWDSWLKTQGLDWHNEYLDRLNPSQPFQENLRSFIDNLPRSDLRILDVGAGPLTVLGKVHPQKRLEIVACDPLATYYDALMEAYDVRPPVHTMSVYAESLTDTFAPESFDLVHARNAIDHSMDPLRAIDQMLQVCKVGCYVVLHHFVNEGETANYAGFHQWNLTVEDGRFIVRTKAQEAFDVNQMFATRADISAVRSGNWMEVTMKKRADEHIPRQEGNASGGAR